MPDTSEDRVWHWPTATGRWAVSQVRGTSTQVHGQEHIPQTGKAQFQKKGLCDRFMPTAQMNPQSSVPVEDLEYHASRLQAKDQ